MFRLVSISPLRHKFEFWDDYRLCPAKEDDLAKTLTVQRRGDRSGQRGTSAQRSRSTTPNRIGSVEELHTAAGPGGGRININVDDLHAGQPAGRRR